MTEEAQALADCIAITTSAGTKQVKIERFPALDGYEISRAYRDYVMSKEPEFRRAFVRQILSYASVEETTLDTTKAIDNLLENWRNVEKIFLSVLQVNNVDTHLEEEKNNYWNSVGETLAAYFIAGSARLMLPLLQEAETNRLEDEEESRQRPN